MELQPQPDPLDGVNQLPFAEPKPNKPLQGVEFREPLDLNFRPPLAPTTTGPRGTTALIPPGQSIPTDLIASGQGTKGTLSTGLGAGVQIFGSVLADELGSQLGDTLGTNVKAAFSGNASEITVDAANVMGLTIPFNSGLELASESITEASVEVVPESLELPLDALESPKPEQYLPALGTLTLSIRLVRSGTSFKDTGVRTFYGISPDYYIVERTDSSEEYGQLHKVFLADSTLPEMIQLASNRSFTFHSFVVNNWSQAGEAEYKPGEPSKARASLPARSFGEADISELMDTGLSDTLNLPGFSSDPFLDTEALEEKLEQGFTEAELQDSSNWEDIPEESRVPRRDPVTGEPDLTKPLVPPWALPDDEWTVAPPDDFPDTTSDTKDPPRAGLPFPPVTGQSGPPIKPIVEPPPVPEFPEIPPPEETCDPCAKLDEILAILACDPCAKLDEILISVPLISRIYQILGGSRWFDSDGNPSFKIDAEAAINSIRTNIYPDDEQEDTETYTATDLITLLQINAAVQYQRSGFHRLPAVVPENLVLDPDDDEDPNLRIVDLFTWQEWQLKQLDQLFGAWPLKINFKNAEGEESIVKLENTSEAIAELYGLLLNVASESDLQTELAFKAITEAIGAKVAATNAYDYAKGNAEFLGYKGNSKNKEIPLTITPGAENLRDSLKEGKKKLPRWQNEDQLDLVSLTTKILFAAEIIKSVFYQQYDSDRGLYGETLADRRKDEQGQEEDRWRQFLDELRNPAGVRYSELNPRPDINNLASEENDGD